MQGISAEKTAQILAGGEDTRVNVNIRDEKGKVLITAEQKGSAFFQIYIKQMDSNGCMCQNKIIKKKIENH